MGMFDDVEVSFMRIWLIDETSTPEHNGATGTERATVVSI
jgi:hypothetical protein